MTPLLFTANDVIFAVLLVLFARSVAAVGMVVMLLVTDDE
jgi:hypothetical protein